MVSWQQDQGEFHDVQAHVFAADWLDAMKLEKALLDKLAVNCTFHF